MPDTSNRQFTLIIAYILPGFLSLAGVVPLLPAVGAWLRPVPQGDFGVGPTVYALLSAAAAGMVISCVRWLVIDHIHNWTGVNRSRRDDSRLAEVLNGYDYLIQIHWRYYEFAGNALIALLFAYILNRSLHTLPTLGHGTDLGVVILSLVLFAASRDALAKFYRKTGLLLGHVAEKDVGDLMYNGGDKEHEGAAKTPPRDQKPIAPEKPPAKPPEAEKGKKEAK